MSAAPRWQGGPYKGLAPYAEDDTPFFFGRDMDRQLVIANLLGARLTLFYGPSGVGKSSLLQAGIVAHLRRLAREDLEEHGAPELAVATFSSWQGDPIRGVLAAAATAVQDAWGGSRTFEPVPDGLGLVEGLRAWTERLGGILLVLLDQFEEYFLYHPSWSSFETELPAVVNAPELQVNLLLSLREDALAQLDRLKGKLPTLFQNYLRLEHPGREAARSAIEEPLAAWSRKLGLAPEEAYRVEPRLVEEVLDQLTVSTLTIGRDRSGLEPSPGLHGEWIETPYLQLVLRRLWEEEERLGSRVLRRETLAYLGGARDIVQTHLDGALAALSLEEREAAAEVLRYLVTPGGAKIALGLRDLAEYARLPVDRVESVLRELSSPVVRVLRRVSEPEGTTHYEIFHDVLGKAILEWRQRFESEQEQSEAKERLAHERKRLRRLLAGAIGLAALLMLIILLLA